MVNQEGTIVIVGGGVAGGTAALTLRSEGFEGRVVLVGEEPHPPYSKPPLSKAVVRGEAPPERAHLRPAKVWQGKEIELLLGRAVDALYPAHRLVELEDGERLAYDKLLLATGGRPRTLAGIDGHTLRSIDDALRIRELFGPGRAVTIVGAGFIGAELAASARTVGTAVTMYEAAALPLARVLPPELGAIYAGLHRDRGVDLRCGVPVVAEHLDGDPVIVAVGLEPDVTLAREAGLQVSDGIVVDELCRTSAPHVYAAGDVANHPNPILGRRVRIEHWQNAQHQAQAAARSMLGGEEPFAEVPWVWSDQYDVNLQVAGIPAPTDDVEIHGDVDALAFCAHLRRDGRLVAAIGVNAADDVRAAREQLAAGVPA